MAIGIIAKRFVVVVVAFAAHVEQVAATRVGICSNGNTCTSCVVDTCANGANCYAYKIRTCENGANCYCFEGACNHGVDMQKMISVTKEVCQDEDKGEDGHKVEDDDDDDDDDDEHKVEDEGENEHKVEGEDGQDEDKGEDRDEDKSESNAATSTAVLAAPVGLAGHDQLAAEDRYDGVHTAATAAAFPSTIDLAFQLCPDGFFKPAGATSCSACPSGKQPNAQRTECEPCPDDSAGVHGMCKRCFEGSQPNDDFTICINETVDGLTDLQWEVLLGILGLLSAVPCCVLMRKKKKQASLSTIGDEDPESGEASDAAAPAADLEHLMKPLSR